MNKIAEDCCGNNEIVRKRILELENNWNGDEAAGAFSFEENISSEGIRFVVFPLRMLGRLRKIMFHFSDKDLALALELSRQMIGEMSEESLLQVALKKSEILDPLDVLRVRLLDIQDKLQFRMAVIESEDTCVLTASNLFLPFFS